MLTHALPPALTPSGMLDFASRTTARSELLDSLPVHPHERTWLRIDGPRGSEAWLIGWPPGAGTGWHDHGGSLGALFVVRGVLHEYTLPVQPARLGEGLDLALGRATETQVRLPPDSGRSFPTDHIHDVRNNSTAEHAVSLHIYAPELTAMHRYERTADRLVYRSTETAAEW